MVLWLNMFFSARGEKNQSENWNKWAIHTEAIAKKKDNIAITFWALHSNFRVFVVFPTQIHGKCNNRPTGGDEKEKKRI